MKKDYLPVLKNEQALSEIDYVEKYWTKIWESNKSLSLFAEAIERREEFKITSQFFSEFTSDSRILDGGCGMGEWTLYYASKGYKVFGVDISRNIIQKLKERFNDVNFIVGDIRNTEFANNYFDAYYSWGTFEHFENGFGAPLEEARRIIKKGGYLFLSVPFQNARHLLRDNRELWHWDENYDKYLGYQSDIRFYQWRLTKSELKRELGRNGFRTLQIETIHKEHGLLGVVQHDLHIEPNSRVGKVLQCLLNFIVPKNFVAHMILAIAQKV